VTAERRTESSEEQRYVVEYDCGEAIITPPMTEAQAWQSIDPVGCLPAFVYPLSRCILKSEPWIREGYLRCELWAVNLAEET
jgi:hypothetical protein